MKSESSGKPKFRRAKESVEAAIGAHAGRIISQMRAMTEALFLPMAEKTLRRFISGEAAKLFKVSDPNLRKISLAGEGPSPETSRFGADRGFPFQSRLTHLTLDRAWAANSAYMPFGFGGRACVGLNVAMLELQMVALEFALAFVAEVVSSVPAAPPHPSITLVPPPITLRLVPRTAGNGAGADSQVAA